MNRIQSIPVIIRVIFFGGFVAGLSGCAGGTAPNLPDVKLPVISDADKQAALECALVLVPAGIANPAGIPIAAALTPACRLLTADVVQLAIAKAREIVAQHKAARGTS